jgi:hypothetical protein
MPLFAENFDLTLFDRQSNISGLPDGLFSNQNPYLGKFWRALEWYILWSF